MSDHYTLCTHDKHGEFTVFAAGLSASEAVKIIAEDSGKWRAGVHHKDYEAAGFRRFEFTRFDTTTYVHDKFVVSATVPLTTDLHADEAAATRMLEVQVQADHREYWQNHVFTDGQYAEKVARKAAWKSVNDLDRLITRQLIAALIADGYAIKANVMEDAPRHRRSKNVDRIVEHLFEFDMVEIIAIKGKEEAWIRLIFGEAGWDVVQDYSTNIEKIVDAIVDPHLPWNKPGAGAADRCYEVFTLPSPDQAASGQHWEASFMSFVEGMEGAFGKI